MNKLTYAFACGLLAITAHADPKPDAAAKSKPPALKNGAILLKTSDLDWVEDAKRPGTFRALAEGNPDTGPAHFYLKYNKGFTGGEHHHTFDHGGWVLEGTVILVIDGQETKLPPGSFYFVAGKKPHAAKCDPAADCVMTVDVRGKWDVIPEKK